MYYVYYGATNAGARSTMDKVHTDDYMYMFPKLSLARCRSMTVLASTEQESVGYNYSDQKMKKLLHWPLSSTVGVIQYITTKTMNNEGNKLHILLKNMQNFVYICSQRVWIVAPFPKHFITYHMKFFESVSLTSN